MLATIKNAKIFHNSSLTADRNEAANEMLKHKK
jgi:hypothetical protein